MNIYIINIFIYKDKIINKKIHILEIMNFYLINSADARHPLLLKVEKFYKN